MKPTILFRTNGLYVGCLQIWAAQNFFTYVAVVATLLELACQIFVFTTRIEDATIE